MADTVQYRLERMHPELDDLERRGLFTKHEILDIVKHRRKFEYRLKRPSPLKRDFLDYIDYESQLDALRKLRKKEESLKRRSNASVSDFAAVTRIVDIYRLATLRFKADLDLWFRYLEFCRTRHNGRMKKVLAQVLRFHPKVPGVWIYAAAWEFDQNLNIVSARALMQNGLRVCPTSEDLWVEYLRMELTYMNKLKSRKVALGEDMGSLVKGENDEGETLWKEKSRELYMPLEEVKPNNSDFKANIFDEKGLNLVKTVYSSAIEAIPHSFSLRQRLLDICEAIDLRDSCDSQTEILEDMKSAFGSDPKYWDWLARKQLFQRNAKDGIDEARKVYEEGITMVNSPAMYNFYSNFLLENLSLGSNEESSSSVGNIFDVYERAMKSNCIDEDMMCEYISLYLKMGKFDEAREVVTDLCCGKMMNTVGLCMKKIAIDLKLIANSSEDFSLVFKFLLDTLSRIPLSKAYDLWQLAFKISTTDEKLTRQLIETAYFMVAKHGGDDCQHSVPSLILKFVLHRDGIEKARDFYKRFLKLPRPGLSLYKSSIEMEESVAFLGDEDALVNARKLYFSALEVDDQNTGLWKDYFNLELKMGTSETSNAVYWRAGKVVKNFPGL